MRCLHKQETIYTPAQNLLKTLQYVSALTNSHKYYEKVCAFHLLRMFGAQFYPFRVKPEVPSIISITSAPFPVRCQFIAFSALAIMAPSRVHALVLATSIIIFAFINVCDKRQKMSSNDLTYTDRLLFFFYFRFSGCLLVSMYLFIFQSDSFFRIHNLSWLQYVSLISNNLELSHHSKQPNLSFAYQ